MSLWLIRLQATAPQHRCSVSCFVCVNVSCNMKRKLPPPRVRQMGNRSAFMAFLALLLQEVWNLRVTAGWTGGGVFSSASSWQPVSMATPVRRQVGVIMLLWPHFLHTSALRMWRLSLQCSHLRFKQPECAEVHVNQHDETFTYGCAVLTPHSVCCWACWCAPIGSLTPWQIESVCSLPPAEQKLTHGPPANKHKATPRLYFDNLRSTSWQKVSNQIYTLLF